MRAHVIHLEKLTHPCRILRENVPCTGPYNTFDHNLGTKGKLRFVGLNLIKFSLIKIFSCKYNRQNMAPKNLGFLGGAQQECVKEI